ncbi:Ger(x)C family spore germination protein [Bacillus timonensis]|nr:Ger(x)C family spore germination protein [Bacillus timonensis]
MNSGKIIFVCLTIFLLTGCWDYAEIEDKAFIFGMAIDKADSITREEAKELSERDMEYFETQKGKPTYAYTAQIPIIPRMQIKPVGLGGSGEKDRTWEVTIHGNSFFEVNREFNTRVDYLPFYEHLQVIIISEDVAREGIIKPLDLFLRDHEMRRRTTVFIAPGKAKDILKVNPKVDDFASIYLSRLPNNAVRSSRILHIADLGDISESLHGKIDFVIPRVIASKDEIKGAGSAVFKKDKLVGWLGEIDTIYVKWIRDNALGGLIVVESPKEKGSQVALEIKKIKTKVRPYIENGEIKMKIDTNVDANLAEVNHKDFYNTFSEEYISEVEKIAEETSKERMANTIVYVQKEFGTDIFYFHTMIKRYNPKEWEKVKDNWDELFPKMKTDITVNINIIMTGNVE